MEEDYTPFGDEWEKELMKISKPDLCKIFGIENKGTKKEMIEIIRNRLKEE